jgi:hypothetical protein
MLGLPLPFDVEVVGLKPCVISDILHILNELEYLPPLISNPKAYYIFYWFKILLTLKFSPLVLGTLIKLEDFNEWCKLDNLEYPQYLAYNIICGYINSNDSHGYGRSVYLASCLGIYPLCYYYKPKVPY